MLLPPREGTRGNLAAVREVSRPSRMPLVESPPYVLAVHLRERSPAGVRAAVGVVAAAWPIGTLALAVRLGSVDTATLLTVGLLPLFILLVFVDPRIGLWAVFVTFPFASVHLGGPSWLQLPEAAVLGVTGIISLRRLTMGRLPLGWSAPLAWLSCLAAWAVVSLPSALDETLAIKQITQLLFGFLLAGVFLAVCRDSADARQIMSGLVAIAVITVVVGIAAGGASRLRPQYGGAQVQGRFQGPFDQPNQLGSFSSLVILVAIGLALGAKTPRARVLWSAAIAVLLVGLTLSLSRGAWIGFAFGILYLLAKLAQARRIALVLALPLILGIVLFARSSSQLDIQTVKARASSLTIRSPYDSRSDIYAEARREILDDPLTGQGAGSFPVASKRSASAANSVFSSHAHDIWLTWAAECGIPAALLITGLGVSLGFSTRTARRAALVRGDYADQAFITGLAAALLSVAGQGLVDYVFRNEVLFISLWCVIAALLVAKRQAAPSWRPLRRGRHSRQCAA